MSTPVLKVDGDLTVYAVHALRDQLMAALAESPMLEVDLSEVTEVDGAGLQLLLAARHEAVLREGKLTVSGVSPVVAEALGVMGLNQGLERASTAEEEVAA